MQGLFIAALCVCVHPLLCLGAAMCPKKGACTNVVDGNQSRPVLSGLQNYVNTDGTCKYGHAGVGGNCKAGWNCGYTWYECMCIDEDAATEGRGDDTTLQLFFGVLCCLLPILAIVIVVTLEKNKATMMSRTVAPAKDLEAKRPHSDSTQFADVCKAPQVDQTTSPSTQASKSEPFDPCSKIDGLGFFCFIGLGIMVVFGAVLIVMALTAEGDQYFNECDGQD